MGIKAEDTIMEALKESEMEMLDSVWKRVQMNQSLSELCKKVGRPYILFKPGNEGPLGAEQSSQHNMN